MNDDWTSYWSMIKIQNILWQIDLKVISNDWCIHDLLILSTSFNETRVLENDYTIFISIIKKINAVNSLNYINIMEISSEAVKNIILLLHITYTTNNHLMNDFNG